MSHECDANVLINFKKVSSWINFFQTSEMIKIIYALSKKNLKMMFRKNSNQTLLILSSALVFGILIFCCHNSHNLNFFSSVNTFLPFFILYLSLLWKNGYTQLAFDLICNPRFSTSSSVTCKPYTTTPSKLHANDEGLSPATALLQLIETGSIVSDDNSRQSALDVATLLGSLIMNGFPLLGLDDFISLSDFINSNLGNGPRSQIMSSTVFEERFGNFLQVRERQFRIAPSNCWTNEFINHLKAQSNIFEVYKNIISYTRTLHYLGKIFFESV